MYPLLRLWGEVALNRRRRDLSLLDTHVSRHTLWPQDIDPWRELNNGRTLTLYDLGRLGLWLRNGLQDVQRRMGWGDAVAGCSVRYRQRLRAFDRIEMRSRLVGWDARFVYVEQGIWRGGECANHVLIRNAITGPDGMVPTQAWAGAAGIGHPSPPLPEWVAAWAEADNRRPWPPVL